MYKYNTCIYADAIMIAKANHIEILSWFCSPNNIEFFIIPYSIWSRNRANEHNRIGVTDSRRGAIVSAGTQQRHQIFGFARSRQTFADPQQPGLWTSKARLTLCLWFMVPYNMMVYITMIHLNWIRSVTHAYLQNYKHYAYLDPLGH